MNRNDGNGNRMHNETKDKKHVYSKHNLKRKSCEVNSPIFIKPISLPSTTHASRKILIPVRWREAAHRTLMVPKLPSLKEENEDNATNKPNETTNEGTYQ